MNATAHPSADLADSSGTRSALLEAAADVFAEVGFHHATVRQICQRAGANIAAVNYHFGDKEQLYAEVMQESFGKVLKKYPLDAGQAKEASPEDRLRAFVRGYFQRIFAAGGERGHGRLIMREMIEPTGALDLMIQQVVRPTSLVLDGIVRDLLGEAVPLPARKLCAMSIIGQAVFYIHCQPVIRRAFPDFKLGPEEIERLAGHVATFSLAGIQAIKDSAKPSKRRPG